MENTENQEVKSPRSRLAERYSKKYPDKAINGETNENDEDLIGFAADEMDESDKRSEARAEVDRKLNDMFRNDRRGARSFIRMSEGEDPAIALLDEYGPEFLEALQSEEGKEKFKESTEKWKQEEIDNQKAEEEWDRNLDETSGILAAFAEKHGMDDEAVAGLVGSLYDWASNAVSGKITEEMLDAAFKAGDYDNAVAEAREEGEVNGRNAKIKAQLRDERKSPSALPHTVGSRADEEPETPREKKASGYLAMFGGIPARKK